LTTSNKNFRVKNGLEVLGVSATVDGNEVLTTASTLDALANVDTTGVLDGNTIVFNEATSTFIAGAISGGAAFEISDTAPENPEHGDVWYNSANGGLFIRYNDGFGSYEFEEDSSAFYTDDAGRGYTLRLDLSWTRNESQNSYAVYYEYRLFATTSSFFGFAFNGGLQINGSTVWTPSGTYAVSQNNNTLLTSGSTSLPYGQFPELDIPLNVVASFSAQTPQSFLPLPSTIAASDITLVDVLEPSSEQWVQIGLTGPRGPQGLQGPEGPMGYTGATGAQGDPGLNGLDGLNGLSAYEVAVNEGFSGTEQDWLDSLVGTDGLGYDVTVDANASYTEIQKLLASDPENFSKFGNAVSISGDGKTMVVSAPTEDTSPNSDNGAVYVFTRSGTSWVEQAKLIASDANSMRLFGTSISISEDGNTIVVGTPRLDPFFNVYDGGVAYIFTRSGTTWTEQAKLIANDMTVYDYFGQSVSISGNGNTVIVGAYSKNANMFSQSTGAAYIFTRSGSTWTEQEKLVASDPAWYDYFGKAVAISADGSTAFAQAANEDTSPNNDNGAVYVFTNSGTSWTEQAKLLASDAASYENFGNSISASEEGNTVVIGSSFKTTTPNDQNGAVYVFTRSGSTWNEEAKLIASDTESYEAFGSSVSISADGDTIVVGAEAENTAPSYGNGAAYIFTRSSSTWTQQAKLLATNLDSSDTFGRSVSISADKSTVIVGSVFGEPNDTGSIYVFNLNLTWDPAVFSIGAYLGNSYVKAISSPSTYAEGILNTSEFESYSILVESASGSFDLDALNTVSLSIAGVPGITGANGADGTNGADGADGAGYDYVMPENFGGPGIELEPAGTSITLNTYVGSGDFGAYVVGNYVRYYPNPEADPAAWVEGEITSRTTEFYEGLTILIYNWSPQAPGIIGASFDATIRPYMTIVAKDGAGYSYEPIPGSSYSVDLSIVTPGTPGFPTILALGSGKVGAYKVGDFVKWTSNDDPETYLYGQIYSLGAGEVTVIVTEVSLGTVTTVTSARLSIAGLPGKSAYEIAVDEGFTGVEEDWLTALVPAGTVSQTARATAPPGYLLCDGSAVSRTTYARLFDAIGTAYGAGNNSTTFNIPNLQGRVPVGRDSSQSEFDVLGEVGGAKTHTLTTAQMPSHTHTQNAHNHTQDSHNHTQNAHGHNIHLGATQLGYTNSTAATGTNLGAMVGGNNGFVATNVTATNNATTATNQATTATNQNTGGGEAHNNLQPYVVLNYMIKI
jgi:microcystin-dependent protein